MASSILASLILGFRKGISEESLMLWYGAVHRWIEAKGGICNTTAKPSVQNLKNSLDHLRNFINCKRMMYEPKSF